MQSEILKYTRLNKVSPPSVGRIFAVVLENFCFMFIVAIATHCSFIFAIGKIRMQKNQKKNVSISKTAFDTETLQTFFYRRRRPIYYRPFHL